MSSLFLLRQILLYDLWMPFTDSCVPDGPSKVAPQQPESLYEAWLASRSLSNQNTDSSLPAGAKRPVTRTNLRLARRIATLCLPQMQKLFWDAHPFRTIAVILVSLIRGAFPVFKGYSHALIINEVQNLLFSEHFTWSRLVRLLGTELLRATAEKILDSFATENEQLVQSSARFVVEYQQMEQRVRLDVPTMSDPIIRDLVTESDVFVSSFQGMGGFSLLSPFDFVRVFTLLSELISHVFVLSSLTYGPLSVITLIFSLISSAYPFVHSYFLPYRFNYDPSGYGEQEMRHAEKQEQMRQLSVSESHRPEVMLFGLGPWILDSWASSRKFALGLQSQPGPSKFGLSQLLSHINVAELITTAQNIPFVLMLRTSPSLGSLALYRNSVQSVVYTANNLFLTAQMAIQGIFLMGAFCAAMEVEPALCPKKECEVRYESQNGGMKIEARNLSYTYPGCVEPALRNINLTLEAGETLALVGYNGSGKSTLAKILLRILDFSTGALCINGTDVRAYDPAALHRASAAVFQGFARYAGSVADNVGVGCVHDMRQPAALRRAVRLAESEHIVDRLPRGIHTRLDAGDPAYAPLQTQALAQTQGDAKDRPAWMPHGLSGGEWQRIALARAFMRADRPEVDLLLFDEPTSSLDAHAQHKIFETIDTLARAPDGAKRRTVVFVTHRLATARRADKIAMMERGTITEFGTHDELLRLDGSYAALYRASV